MSAVLPALQMNPEPTAFPPVVAYLWIVWLNVTQPYRQHIYTFRYFDVTHGGRVQYREGGMHSRTACRYLLVVWIYIYLDYSLSLNGGEYHRGS
ncbi:hypothetical protein QBC37DRAFT_417005 [Rhypophila decipiens]|uniref:Uncharacterized protein n=1 Tax=Rhypophila decipiens TaxID=261697 RepID=A0AAN6YBN7_9PEZI|nr:hypothetical protein QBC37DRAFT_417005 [Rhypophila decipiens]